MRPISTARLTELWRESVGSLPGLEFLKFESDAGGPGSGAAISVELSHRRIDVLEKASAELAEALGFFPNVTDIDDGFSPGKQQIDFQIKPEGRSLGLHAGKWPGRCATPITAPRRCVSSAAATRLRSWCGCPKPNAYRSTTWRK